jgi:hypothetical protein
LRKRICIIPGEEVTFDRQALAPSA